MAFERPRTLGHSYDAPRRLGATALPLIDVSAITFRCGSKPCHVTKLNTFAAPRRSQEHTTIRESVFDRKDRQFIRFDGSVFVEVGRQVT